MKACFFVLVFVLFFAGHNFGQDICQGKYLSFAAEQIYRSKKNLAVAIDLYKQAFDAGEIDGSKIFDAINCAAQENDGESAEYFIKTGISLGIPPASFIEFWKTYKTDLDVNQIFKQLDTTKLLHQYNTKLNKNLIQQLKKLAEQDQKYRSQDEFEWKYQLKLDRKNWKALRKLTRAKGRLPHYSEIGFNGADDMEIIFYHMDKKRLNWFLPYIIESIRDGESNLGHTTLYQLDRVGMDEGLIHIISENHEIKEFGKRTKMKNGYFCQVFGEWFYEKSRVDGKLYETPYEPNISMEQVNQMRALFCLDSVASKRKRKPWLNVVDIATFEDEIRD